MKRIPSKQIFLALIISCLMLSAQAQLPIITKALQPLHGPLEIGYYTTTLLVFPASIWDADRGYKDVIVEKQANITNVLKIKAFRKDFTPTNIHVYTTDGRVYSFTVEYKEYPAQTTLIIVNSPGNSAAAENTPTPIIEKALPQLNEKQVQETVEKARREKSFLSQSTRNQKMKLSLQGIHSAGDLMFFTLELKNKSNLAYAVDFLRFYVQDRKKIKRSTIQQQEIIPSYKEEPFILNGHQHYRIVVAIPRFTIDKQKSFLIELFEMNGGRHLALTVDHKQLLKARKL